MELQDYLLVLRKNWLIIVLLTVLGAGAGVAYSLLATPSYSASSKVFVSTTGADNASELQQGNSFTVQRVQTYADLVRTAAVLQPTIEELGLDVSASGLRGMISASAPTNTSVIDVTATNTDPVYAASLATGTANALIEVVEAIETTDAADGASPVQLTLVQEAEIPQAPVSPNKPLNTALGLLLGLAAGLAIALLRHALDTRIRGERDLELLAETPVIGGIVFDPKATERPLVIHADPRSPRAESFRTLRTNLQFLDAGRERSFVVTSALPGEGKSTTAANLAISLSDAGAKVLLVGADLRKPKMAEYMGIEGGVGLSDVLIGRMGLHDAVQRWGRTSLYLLPAGAIPPNPSELLGSTAMSQLIERLNDEFDVVLYDAPPLLPVTDAAVLSRLVGGSVVVVAAGKTRTHQVEGALDALANVAAPVSGFVLTMLPTKGPDAYGYGRYGYASSTYGEKATKK
ncbi:polysaccharide biosynthesis tyrosine autokinase [Demequina sp. NBRC 110055]|uniref:polysaccharide biosynthesis tyrosine autokinase n=1 Tax=Demequina sp. NBRC 110055 TaxID=1570344 RepID=UPI000A078134|nr:polysaccharide biosynthesis tyrosine autokinase [Demequina sp. NBRC 110055]